MRRSGKASEKLFYKPFRGNDGVMSTEDQIRWVTVTLNFSPDEEAGLEKQERGPVPQMLLRSYRS